ncbi:hypothetical protein NBRC116188_06090 [Oceaniserpentilla sp. 4NH20-0058]|uniref:hypothetical protein n=1 Tax=Oceaniserpentilla sp. 4NH20-0058 TaxID=3127660 RepID=UPI0031031324
MNTNELQEVIKGTIDGLGWKIPKLAEVLYIHLNDEEPNEEESIRKFYEKLKGQLKRPTTPPEVLEQYINVIRTHPDYQKCNTVLPQYIPGHRISSNIQSGMKRISKNITKGLANDL